VTVVYTATISNTAAAGTTITNTATITTPKGTGATPSAPVVTVAGTTTGTGTKLLYLYDGTSSPAWKLSTNTQHNLIQLCDHQYINIPHVVDESECSI